LEIVNRRFQAVRGVEMFGRQDADQSNNQPGPTADATLAQDAAATASPADMSMPTPVNNASGAPAVQPSQNNSAGKYIMPDESTKSGTPATTGGGDDLLVLKQQALQQLTPLIGHLDQTPEEKFRTTMMMIQAADNQALLKDAYAAAQAIPDEKVRAQALLDVVNEINYFTQQHEQPAA
jgi:hypothetical protein